MSIAHIKTNEFDKEGKEISIDVGRCINIFKKVGFDGFLSIEFEGKGDEYQGVESTIKLIRTYI